MEASDRAEPAYARLAKLQHRDPAAGLGHPCHLGQRRASVGDVANTEGDATAVSAEDKAKRFDQQPAIVAINGSNPEVTAKALDRRLFEMGKVAAIATNEQAEVLKNAGLIALVAGGADDANISLAADEDSLDSMIANLQEKGII